jgi:hypothetical protein
MTYDVFAGDISATQGRGRPSKQLQQLRADRPEVYDKVGRLCVCGGGGLAGRAQQAPAHYHDSSPASCV